MTRQIFRVTKDATWKLARILEDAEEFNSDRDSFRGRKNSSPDFGRMKNPENKRQLEQFIRDGKVDYVIFSYATPIAYRIRENSGHAWVMPGEKYSRTTSRHQGKARAALAAIAAHTWGPAAARPAAPAAPADRPGATAPRLSA